MSDKVLCIKREALPEKYFCETYTGATTLPQFFKESGPPVFISRKIAESDTDFQQIIPYCLTINEKNEFACYPRAGSERRLHGLYSIGVGGHVDEQDAADSYEKTIMNGLIRELGEEFIFNSEIRERPLFLGVIKEEITKVGRVHIGLVFLLKTEDDLKPGEELEGLQWIPREKLGETPLELWSELALSLELLTGRRTEGLKD